MAKKKVEKEVVVTKASIHDFNVIIKPVITEKTMALLQDQNKVTVEVPADANKIEIKDAFERIFGVKVTGVSTVNTPRKATTRGGRYSGFLGGFKKAIVTVKDGQAIDLFKD